MAGNKESATTSTGPERTFEPQPAAIRWAPLLRRKMEEVDPKRAAAKEKKQKEQPKQKKQSGEKLSLSKALRRETGNSRIKSLHGLQEKIEDLEAKIKAAGDSATNEDRKALMRYLRVRQEIIAAAKGMARRDAQKEGATSREKLAQMDRKLKGLKGLREKEEEEAKAARKEAEPTTSQKTAEAVISSLIQEQQLETEAPPPNEQIDPLNSELLAAAEKAWQATLAVTNQRLADLKGLRKIRIIHKFVEKRKSRLDILESRLIVQKTEAERNLSRIRLRQERGEILYGKQNPLAEQIKKGLEAAAKEPEKRDEADNKALADLKSLSSPESLKETMARLQLSKTYQDYQTLLNQFRRGLEQQSGRALPGISETGRRLQEKLAPIYQQIEYPELKKLLQFHAGEEVAQASKEVFQRSFQNEEQIVESLAIINEIVANDPQVLQQSEAWRDTLDRAEKTFGENSKLSELFKSVRKLIYLKGVKDPIALFQALESLKLSPSQLARTMEAPYLKESFTAIAAKVNQGEVEELKTDLQWHKFHDEIARTLAEEKNIDINRARAIARLAIDTYALLHPAYFLRNLHDNFRKSINFGAWWENIGPGKVMAKEFQKSQFYEVVGQEKRAIGIPIGLVYRPIDFLLLEKAGLETIKSEKEGGLGYHESRDAMQIVNWNGENVNGLSHQSQVVVLEKEIAAAVPKATETNPAAAAASGGENENEAPPTLKKQIIAIRYQDSKGKEQLKIIQIRLVNGQESTKDKRFIKSDLLSPEEEAALLRGDLPITFVDQKWAKIGNQTAVSRGEGLKSGIFTMPPGTEWDLDKGSLVQRLRALMHSGQFLANLQPHFGDEDLLNGIDFGAEDWLESYLRGLAKYAKGVGKREWANYYESGNAILDSIFSQARENNLIMKQNEDRLSHEFWPHRGERAAKAKFDLFFGPWLKRPGFRLYLLYILFSELLKGAFESLQEK